MEYINIEAQINNSNSLFLKKLPGFIVKGIARVTKQDEINRILTKYSDAVGVDFLPKILEELNIHVCIEGLENGKSEIIRGTKLLFPSRFHAKEISYLFIFTDVIRSCFIPFS